jgi:hypothetical protein
LRWHWNASVLAGTESHFQQDKKVVRGDWPFRQLKA